MTSEVMEKSDGKSGHIDTFDLFISDLGRVIDFIKQEYRAERISLFGHSMGALITAAFTQQKEDIYEPEKVFINAPPIKVPGALGKIVDCIPLNSIKKLDGISGSVYLKGLVDLVSCHMIKLSVRIMLRTHLIDYLLIQSSWLESV